MTPIDKCLTSLSSAQLFSKPVTSPKVELAIMYCSKCMHAENTNFDLKALDMMYTSDEYVAKSMLHGSMRESLLILAKKIPELLRDKENCSYLEIGPGKGDLINLIRNNFSNITVFEPSEEFNHVEVNNSSKVQIFNELFDLRDEDIKKNLLGKSFDMIVMRHVIEHLVDPLPILEQLASVLSPTGYLYIETPNFSQTLTDVRFTDFFNDHVHYFSVNSIVKLLSQAGFKVHHICDFYRNKHLGVFVRLDSPYENAIARYREIFLRQLEDGLANGNDYAVWGAGAQGVSLMHHLSEKKIKPPLFIFDNDNSKKGKFVGIHEFPAINNPCQDDFLNISIIIISANLHDGEIREQLLDFGYNGKIWSL